MATIGSISQSQPGPRVWARALLAIGRVLLGAVFLFVAFQNVHFGGEWHLRDYYLYSAMSIDSYSLLPLWAIRLIAPILPWFELMLGALLIVGAGMRWTGLFASVFMIVHSYTSVVTQLRNTGDGFSVKGNLVPPILIRDGSLLLLALAVTLGAFLIKRRRP
jgi:uncharacterized membrane protein YphA (DoxX/SURF4 family)